jgi:hypothetical protein
MQLLSCLEDPDLFSLVRHGWRQAELGGLSFCRIALCLSRLSADPGAKGAPCAA